MPLRDEIAALFVPEPDNRDELLRNAALRDVLALVDKHEAEAKPCKIVEGDHSLSVEQWCGAHTRWHKECLKPSEEMPGAACTVAYEKWCATMGEPHPDGGPRCTPSMAFQAGFDAARSSKPSEDRPAREMRLHQDLSIAFASVGEALMRCSTVFEALTALAKERSQ